MNATTRADWRTPTLVLVACGTILTLSFGIRAGFGLFLTPITHELGWGRTTFALALAVQNLMWGATQPFAGMVADKWGAGRVVVGGALLYCAGLALMGLSHSPAVFTIAAGMLVGTGLSGLAFSTVAGVLGKVYPPEKRSMALGISAAAGSFGQFVFLPVAQSLITHIGWRGALLALSAIGLLMVPLASAMVVRQAKVAHVFQQSVGEALREARRHRGFVLLTLGFFVCGFQVVFIGVHLPAYLIDKGFAASVGVTALALVGLGNIFGTYLTGWLGGHMPKRWILSFIYFARAVAIALFIWTPLTTFTVYTFAAVMGVLWLSTVPPTNGIVAQVFGARYLAMLSGITFFSHQIGSFLGAWLGGTVFDTTGSYDLVWYLSIALGIAAGLIHLPIDEREIKRQPAAQPA
jgi:predicted MFS family arabinose efflux permease